MSAAMPAQYPPGFFAEIVRESGFGPLMSILTPRQQAFIVAFHAAGDGNAANAARAAGFSAKSPISLRVHAHATLHNPRVQAAMHEYARTCFQANAPVYMKELHHIATSRTVKDDTRLKAVLGSLSRAGLGGEITVNQNHTVVISFDEKLLELKRLAALAGDDPDKAIEGLVQPPDGLAVSDAEYEEIA